MRLGSHQIENFEPFSSQAFSLGEGVSESLASRSRKTALLGLYTSTTIHLIVFTHIPTASRSTLKRITFFIQAHCFVFVFDPIPAYTFKYYESFIFSRTQCLTYYITCIQTTLNKRHFSIIFFCCVQVQKKYQTTFSRNTEISTTYTYTKIG